MKRSEYVNDFSNYTLMQARPSSLVRGLKGTSNVLNQSDKFRVMAIKFGLIVIEEYWEEASQVPERTRGRTAGKKPSSPLPASISFHIIQQYISPMAQFCVPPLNGRKKSP